MNLSSTLRRLALTATLATPAGLAFSPATFAGPQDFRIVNDSNFSVTQVHISPVGSEEWGPNRLQNGYIYPQTTQTFNFSDVSGCLFDIKVVFSDGDSRESREANLCRISRFTIN